MAILAPERVVVRVGWLRAEFGGFLAGPTGGGYAGALHLRVRAETKVG